MGHSPARLCDRHDGGGVMTGGRAGTEAGISDAFATTAVAVEGGVGQHGGS